MLLSLDKLLNSTSVSFVFFWGGGWGALDEAERQKPISTLLELCLYSIKIYFLSVLFFPVNTRRMSLLF